MYLCLRRKPWIQGQHISSYSWRGINHRQINFRGNGWKGFTVDTSWIYSWIQWIRLSTRSVHTQPATVCIHRWSEDHLYWSSAAALGGAVITHALWIPPKLLMFTADLLTLDQCNSSSIDWGLISAFCSTSSVTWFPANIIGVLCRPSLSLSLVLGVILSRITQTLFITMKLGGRLQYAWGREEPNKCHCGSGSGARSRTFFFFSNIVRFGCFSTFSLISQRAGSEWNLPPLQQDSSLLKHLLCLRTS